MLSTLKRFGKAVVPKQFQDSLREIVRRKPVVPDLHWNLRTGLKLSISSYGDWVIYNDVFVDGEYDEPIDRVLRERADGPLTVVDLGANVGYFTLRFIDLLRRREMGSVPLQMTLVEGSPKVAQDLQARIAEADDLGRSVRIVNGLVGRREGVGKIAEGDFHPMNTTMGDGQRGTPVNYVDLTQLIPPGTRIDLLKCDIEGAELQFIENYGSLLKDVHSAVFELHPEICDTDRCMKLLAEAGLTHQTVLRKESNFTVVHFWR